MSGTIAPLLGVVAAWSVLGALLRWPRLAGPGRRRMALLASSVGVLLLLVAVGREEQYQAATRMVYLFGTSYVTERPAAAASLTWYVLCGACLLLGTLGLAVSDRQARALGERWLAAAVGWSLAITALRFVLDKVAAPAPLTFAVGITWLAPFIGGFFALRLREEGRGWGALAASLLVYGVASRAAVAALVVAATTLRLGSHYDVSSATQIVHPLTGATHGFAPGSLAQLLQLGVIPQLLIWPLFTLVAGLAGGAAALAGAAVAGRPRGGRAPGRSQGGPPARSAENA